MRLGRLLVPESSAVVAVFGVSPGHAVVVGDVVGVELGEPDGERDR